MIVKICGLARPQDVETAARLGADVLGMISGVPQSPRNNSTAQLQSLLQHVGTCRSAFLRRNAPLAETLALLQQLQPDILHLCGQETLAEREEILQAHPELEIWQTIGVPVDQPLNAALVSRVQKALHDPSIHQVLIDSSLQGLSGGTGQLIPAHGLLKELGHDSQKIVVAGGLHPANVASLLRDFQLRGVDVSSGVESAPGVKSAKLIEQFLNVVHGAGPD